MMKKYISGAAARLLFPMLVAGAALATTSCSKDSPAVVTQQDFSAADDAAIQKYLADNKITNAKKQPSGLYYIPVITNPNGAQATAGRSVSVLYTGTLLDGTVFDASSQHGNTPISFTLGARQVIAGWDEGIALMKKNEKSILLIPSGLAYGSQTRPPVITANSILRFEVELTNIQ
ncbi:FKBP-type peptidyl-prolyl cis-trans isomerase [Hymenobacter sp. UYCo722]|uniref:FKBP-type peptidyl-prolyl cis-trans isomerase n=1 Tax=Hymenobacter sp. UYCo722 TaxID=3156335 RepID=UPI0033937311